MFRGFGQQQQSRRTNTRVYTIAPVLMDSDTSDDMASGSKARDRGLKGDRVPQWKVSKDTFEGWWYDFDRQLGQT